MNLVNSCNLRIYSIFHNHKYRSLCCIINHSCIIRQYQQNETPQTILLQLYFVVKEKENECYRFGNPFNLTLFSNTFLRKNGNIFVFVCFTLEVLTTSQDIFFLIDTYIRTFHTSIYNLTCTLKQSLTHKVVQKVSMIISLLFYLIQ